MLINNHIHALQCRNIFETDPLSLLTCFFYKAIPVCYLKSKTLASVALCINCNKIKLSLFFNLMNCLNV